MGKTNTTKRLVRVATVSWADNGEQPGEIVSTDVDILFYSPTVRELRDAQVAIEQFFKEHPDEPYYISETLVKRIHSIPHFKVGEGQPTKLSIDWLDEQDLNNLKAINEAVNEVINPKK